MRLTTNRSCQPNCHPLSRCLREGRNHRTFHADDLLQQASAIVGGDEPTALQPLTEALRQPRTIGILVRAALSDGCTPSERLLLPDIAAAGIEFKTTRPASDPALTDIARQISERGGHSLPWWHARSGDRAYRVMTALLSGLLAGVAAISLALADWGTWALVYGLAILRSPRPSPTATAGQPPATSSTP
jgi:hypothetical protein